MDAAADNAGPGPTPSLGQTLAAERERHGLSRAEVAQRLHMSASQVEALEADDFERLPRGTFLRGFVRNYAKLLGVAPDALLGMLAEASPHEPAPRIIVPTQNIRFDPLGERFSGPYVKAATLALVAVVLAFAAMYWWLFIRPTPPAAAMKHEGETVAAAPAASAETRQDASVVPKAPESPDGAAAVPAQPQPASPAPVTPSPKAATVAPNGASPAPKPEAKKPPEPAKAEAPAKAAAVASAGAKPAEPAKAAPGEHVLRFRFKGDSWVEVRDARDRILFQRLNSAGTEAQVRGRPPLSVVVGNAPDVEMFDGDRPFPLEPHTNVAVARFTLE